MAKLAAGSERKRGEIERRGNSLRVKVYAGVDPLTGKRLYLTESTTDEKEAERILTRLLAEVDDERHARSKGTFRVAMKDWLRLAELADDTRETYEMYARIYLYPVFADEPLAKIRARMLEEFYADLLRCRARCDGRPFLEHRIDGPHECREVKHKRPPGRPPVQGYPPHDCGEKGCVVRQCSPHVCRPLGKATVLKLHFMISGTFAAAIRWEWVKVNPAEVARKPRPPAPDPKPPTPEQASRIIAAAWEQDEDWGTLVWLTMVTGVRRGELLRIRWRDVEFTNRILAVHETKNDKPRRVSLDAATIDVLRDLREHYEVRMRALEVEPTQDAYLFSYAATYDQPCNRSGVTHRYARMCAAIGIDSHLHALRHYSATELILAGVDIRTVAGRLGHGGGGVTTLRVYAAWVAEADRRAADILGGRMTRPKRSSSQHEAVLLNDTPVAVPRDVARAVCTRWAERGEEWVSSTDDEFAELCRSYQAQPRNVMTARYGLVVSVETATGLLIMKSTPDPAGALQARAAQRLALLGAGPVVHQVVESASGTWTVMDQVQPGTRVGQSASLDELANVLRPLAGALQSHEFPPISSWLRDRLMNGGKQDLPPGVEAASSQERDRALPILEQLVTDESHALCHGDPSSGNVLRGEHGLVLIDPRAVSGDREYDAAVLALKSGHPVGELARRLQVDVSRAEAWGVVAVAARV
ncbi:tyrosine-type recombinase/integrase [Amycolatopsis sp. H20-H5]|uniref:tyrosine-type recombinase/integrase n=1 Tax=Amycolatopsis sp. H20-H5 TaxID=3046309 RepID=UPI002DB61F27|nr:tyrosine-type recombinase/integrase [Amycolatopsis sp. H20-H5]MEC3974579.1 tyrosine-type recombinase/integrase [Amycolatopsis sp. H20-H5]